MPCARYRAERTRHRSSTTALMHLPAADHAASSRPRIASSLADLRRGSTAMRPIARTRSAELRTQIGVLQRAMQMLTAVQSGLRVHRSARRRTSRVRRRGRSTTTSSTTTSTSASKTPFADPTTRHRERLRAYVPLFARRERRARHRLRARRVSGGAAERGRHGARRRHQRGNGRGRLRARARRASADALAFCRAARTIRSAASSRRRSSST